MKLNLSNIFKAILGEDKYKKAPKHIKIIETIFLPISLMASAALVSKHFDAADTLFIIFFSHLIFILPFQLPRLLDKRGKDYYIDFTTSIIAGSCISLILALSLFTMPPIALGGFIGLEIVIMAIITTSFCVSVFFSNKIFG